MPRRALEYGIGSVCISLGLSLSLSRLGLLVSFSLSLPLICCLYVVFVCPLSPDACIFKAVDVEVEKRIIPEAHRGHTPLGYRDHLERTRNALTPTITRIYKHHHDENYTLTALATTYVTTYELMCVFISYTLSTI